jgi:hypothetical protein
MVETEGTCDLGPHLISPLTASRCCPPAMSSLVPLTGHVTPLMSSLYSSVIIVLNNQHCVHENIVPADFDRHHSNMFSIGRRLHAAVFVSIERAAAKK